MPCWYFDRKEIKNSPSSQDGIDTITENRYRKEGARFIIDAGTKMGLRYDTCATGVVYFHRFYMFHSFKEFYRYVTAACCLFLAGKVEETPKKCKDIIKIAQSLITPSCFQRFGEDPREEVITMERILLKTIKFDLQVEHPYSIMLKYIKYFKDKEKKQKMAQMAWTFINDSLCTTLCLQWEPEIVAVSLMYLASRLTKFEPHEWSNRSSGKSKWWEDIIEGMSMELMEDICHQVLDLYSSKSKKLVDSDSPPQSPAKIAKQQSSPPPPPPPLPDRTPGKRSREDTPSESDQPKVAKTDKDRNLSKSLSSSSSVSTSSSSSTALTGAPIPVAQHFTPTPAKKKHGRSGSQDRTSNSTPDSYTSYNPYVSSQMYTSSFMSQEGSQNIQSLLAGGSSSVPPPSSYPEPQPPHTMPDPTSYPPPTGPTAPPYAYPPPSQAAYAPPPSIPPPHPYPAPQSYDPYAPPRNPSYPPVTYGPPPVTQPPVPHHSYPPPSVPPPQPFSGYNFPPAPSHGTPTHVPPPQVPPPPGNRYPPPTLPYTNQPPPVAGNPPGFGNGPRHYSKPPQKHGRSGTARKDIPALTEIKITGRPEWNLPK